MKKTRRKEKTAKPNKAKAKAKATASSSSPLSAVTVPASSLSKQMQLWNTVWKIKKVKH